MEVHKNDWVASGTINDMRRSTKVAGLLIGAGVALAVMPRREYSLSSGLGLGTAYYHLGGLVRGDLVFWKGHVAIARDGETLIHANAHHMATVIEPIEPAASVGVTVAPTAGTKPAATFFSTVTVNVCALLTSLRPLGVTLIRASHVSMSPRT